MRKKIKDFENYCIYDNGDVINLNTNKILKGSIGENGYKYYRLSKNNNKKMFYAHRLVAEYFIDNPYNLPVINHKDGNKLNNNVDNLEWVSHSENSEHAHQNKLINKRKESKYYKKDEPGEEWRKVLDFHYSISSLGRVRNDNTMLLLSPSLTCGYYKVRLSNKGKVYDFMVHKLVYQIFNEDFQIPKNYVIDHINGNKLDNRLENLRKISLSENVLDALYTQYTNNSCKKVEQLDMLNNHIAYFNSCSQAARELNLDSSTISKVCRGKNKSHGGFKFKYVE